MNRSISKGLITVSLPLLVLASAIIWHFSKDENLINYPVNVITPSIQDLQRKDLKELKESNFSKQEYDVGVIITPEGKKLYRNEEYGFEFEFPAGWVTRQPAFGSKVTSFNMEIITPTQSLPNPILIGVFPKSNRWIDNVRANDEKMGKEYIRVEINGVEADKDELLSDGLPHIDYMFSRGDHWILIGGKKQYENILNDILKTLKFTQ